MTALRNLGTETQNLYLRISGIKNKTSTAQKYEKCKLSCGQNKRRRQYRVIRNYSHQQKEKSVLKSFLCSMDGIQTVGSFKTVQLLVDVFISDNVI